ncbi:hypothetical protein A7X67_04240 [Clostridium sp. W14A]|nr:hypothetical protein A7X67_04240 [Clostridium sp. W14A]
MFLRLKEGGAIFESKLELGKSCVRVEQFVAEHGRFPVAKEMTRENRLPSRRTFEMKVGVSFFEYGKRYHPELVKLSEARHRQHIADSMREKTGWTKETLVAAAFAY